MPPNRSDPASARHARRKHLAGRPISPSKTPQSTTASISAPGKLEPITLLIPPRPSLNPKPHSPPKTKAQPWRHPDELPFIRTGGKTWSNIAIVRFLRATALSIPPAPASLAERWVHVRCADGTLVALPRGYRVPLLWVVKFLWSSVAIVLAEAGGEWDEKKFDLLHVARLIDTLVSGARRAKEEAEAKGKQMDRSWRCAAFDRALRRYWHRWLVMRDEFVMDFWREFAEEEFDGDVLRLGWAAWVLKGHKGFFLTKEEVANGISAAEFTHGLVVDEEKETFAWIENRPESPPIVDAPMPTNTLSLAPVRKVRNDTPNPFHIHAPLFSFLLFRP
ncbi:hypothetical protein B0H12DRAFT_545811 [Mycena haematopus]|nr:hypothetical protein B0H12DRAFT_545811 [Mycena haematopus]